MTDRSIFKVVLVAIFSFWAVLAQAITKQDLERQFRVTVNDEDQTVSLPPGSKVIRGAQPVIHIVHPDTGRLMYLVAHRVSNQYYINIEEALYEISKPELIDSDQEPVFYAVPQAQIEANNQLKQENGKLQKERDALKAQLEQSRKDSADRRLQVAAQQQKVQQLEEEKQQALTKQQDLQRTVDQQKSNEEKLKESLKEKESELEQEQDKSQQKLDQANASTSKANAELRIQQQKQKETEAKFEEEKKQLHKNEKQMQEKLDQAKKAAEKNASELKKQHKKELKEQSDSAKQEVAALNNSNKQLQQNNQQLKDEVRKSKIKAPVAEKSTQTDEKDWQPEPEIPTVPGIASPLLVQAHSSDPLPDENHVEPVVASQDNDPLPVKKKSSKKKKKKKKKKKSPDTADGENGETNQPLEEFLSREPQKLPEKYQKALELLAKHASDKETAKSQKKQRKNKKVSPVRRNTALDEVLQIIRDAPLEDKDFALRVAEELIEHLTGNLEDTKNQKEIKEITRQIHLVIFRYQELFHNYNPLNILDQAFVETELPITIVQDTLAMALMGVVQEQWTEIISTPLNLVMPHTVSDRDNLHISLQALLYSLMANDIDQIERVLALLMNAEVPLSTLFSESCYWEGEIDSEVIATDMEGDQARKIFSLIVYIKRMTDHLAYKVARRTIWKNIDRQRLAVIMNNLQILMNNAAQNQGAFEEGDYLYVESEPDSAPAKIIHDGEINSPPKWFEILNIPVVEVGVDIVHQAGLLPVSQVVTPAQLATAGFVQQLYCLLNPLILPENINLDPEGRLKRLGLIMVQRRPKTNHCLFETARRSIVSGGNLMNFMKSLLRDIVNNSAYTETFSDMQEAGAGHTKQKKFIEALIASAQETGEAVAPDWGGAALYHFLARFLNKPILLVMATGHIDGEQTVALFFQPENMEVHYTSIDEVVQALQSQQNVLIIGFIAGHPQAGAATNTPDGYWVEMSFNSVIAAAAGTHIVDDSGEDKKPDHNGTDHIRPEQYPALHPSVVAPMHMIPGMMGGNIQLGSQK